MASSPSSSKAPCATCANKAAGIFRCEGCLQVFCRKHVIEHRDLLSHQLDEIFIEHDTLQQTIGENKTTQNKQHPIMKQIDKWEQNSIVKIQQIAEEARQQVKKLSTSSSQTSSQELHDLAERLQKARIDDDYVETDLQTWTKMLQKLKDDVTRYSPSICIQEDQTQILVGKMYVSTTTQRPGQSERFGESTEGILIENNGRLATHSGRKHGNALVRGIGEYSSGKHCIRFLFKKSSTEYNTWFYIVSKLKPINQVPSYHGIYGWASNDRTIYANGDTAVDEHVQDMSGQTTFEIEFELDCDNRRVSYVKQGTKNRRKIDVDMKKCPFPWQVEFYLFAVGDSVQLLP